MKLPSSLLVGFGLVGAGLAAPVLDPATDNTPLRPSVGRTDTSLIDAPVNLASTAASIPEQLSLYVSAAVKHLPLFDVGFSVTPVFAVDAVDAQLVTDVDGDLVMISSGQSVRAIIWNPSTHTFYLDSKPGLSARLPVAILLVSLWLLFTCLYLERFVHVSPQATPVTRTDAQSFQVCGK